MDEMNQFEKQLQSWTPRRPSPKIARRLFSATHKAASRSHRAQMWSWLTPLAACALTILVAVHPESPQSAPLASQTNGAIFATFMFGAAGSSNQAMYSLSQLDQNLEWNVWPHASHHVAQTSRQESPSGFNVMNSIPTNR
jgi:hypothetical protein